MIPDRRTAYALAGAALLAYLFVIGTFAGERWPLVRLAGAILGGAVILAAAFGIRRRTDAVDRVSLAVLGLFLVACLASTAHRFSLDAAMTAVAVTAAFLVGREILTDAGARWTLVRVLSVAGTAAAVAFGLVWLGIWLGWIGDFGWRVPPPLDLPLPSGMFGYRHHVADFVVMCAPAMVLHARESGRVSRLLQMVGLAFGAFVVLAAGSRMIWLAIVVAGIVTVVSQGGIGRITSGVRVARERAPRWAPWLTAVAAVGVVILLAGPLASRLLQLSPIEARSEIWGRAVALGAERPWSGWGPGSFPFLLQHTDYFDFNVFAPRHPDNVFVMAFAESGVLGVAGLAAIAVVGAWFIVGRRVPAPTVFAATFLGLVGMTASPTDYGFLYAPLLGWIAWGVPRTSEVTRRSRVRFASAALLVPIGLAFAAMTTASLAHDDARVAAEAGDIASATESAGRAAALDPTFAIYHRDLGWLELAGGHAPAALRSFGAALEANPLDTAALRGAARAALATGSTDEAIDRALEAVVLHESDVRNALLAAAVASEAGDRATADRMALEAMQQAPLLVADPAWATIGIEPTTVLKRAAEATLAGDETSVGSRIPSLRIAWLAALAGETALRDRALESATPYEREGELLLRFASCKLTTADLTDAQPPFAPQFWEVRLVLGALIGADDAGAMSRSVYQVPSLERRAEGGEVDTPLENDGFLDLVGYRRRPVELREPILDLPTLDSALMRLLTGEPVEGVTDRCG